MVFRKADRNDIEQLVRIRLAYLKEDYKDISGEQLEQLRNQLPGYFATHIGRDFIAYIAEDKNEFVAGVFLLVIEKPANPGFMTGKIGNILNVYTKPEYRKQGIATKLLKSAMEDARELKLSYLELKATPEGYPLYKKLGFQEEKSEYTPMKRII